MLFILRVLALFSLFHCVFGRIGCRGRGGSAVDWFIAYKLPIAAKDAAQGRQLLYFDSDSLNWTSAGTVDTPSSPIASTLGQIYSKKKEQFRLLYSDDGPNSKADGYRGHAKGVALFDGVTGFWLSHSVPNFPSETSYSFPLTAVKFGQAFICVTLPADSLNDVGEHLRYIQATPYDSNLPDNFANKYPVLRSVVSKQSLPKSATVFSRSRSLSTPQGMKVLIFAKHKKFVKDLWHDLVAPEISSTLAVQSWLNGGADDLKSNCRQPFSTLDVTTISLPSVTFNSSKDHSKWAVSSSESGRGIVCIGDMNRQKSQMSRGGGAICLSHQKLWQTFNSTVKDVQMCGSNKFFVYFVVILILIERIW